MTVEYAPHPQVAPRERGDIFLPHNCVRTLEFGLQAVAPGHEFGIFRREDRLLGAQKRDVEAKQYVVFLYGIAVSHENPAHRAAVDVFDHLVAVLDPEASGSDHGAREGGENAPAEESASHHNHRHEPHVERLAGRKSPLVHDASP